MRRPITFWSLFGGWILSCVLLFTNIDVRTDSNFLLPRFASPDLRLVTDQLRRGPASNILLIGISGGSKEALARLSDGLAAKLRADPAFELVANGRPVLDPATLAWAKTYRYLLNPPVEADEFGAAALRRAFDELAATLGTSAGLVGEELLFADPTRRLLRILAYFSEQDAPATEGGIWMSADGTMATLVARPKSDPLDLDGQARAIARVRAAFMEVQRDAAALEAKLAVSGPGVFGVAVREQVISDLAWIGTLATVFSIALIWIAFRSLAVLAILIFVVGVGITGGVLAVQLVFGEVHGIAITFGMMLIGVAMDYPTHVLVHGAKDGAVHENLRPVWPTLHLSVLTTAAAFVPFMASNFPGLAQLGVVSIAGILVTYAVTRLLLPSVIGKALLARVPFRRAGWQRPSRRFVLWAWIACALALGGAVAAAAIGAGKVWEDSLVSLSPLSPSQIKTDQQLRQNLKAVNPRFLLIVTDADRDKVLERIESVGAYLDDLVKQQRLAGYDSPSRYLPTERAQSARKAALPAPEVLRARIAEALQGTAFQENAFDDFVSDVAKARAPEFLLTYDAAAASVLGVRLRSLLFPHDGGWAGLIVFRGESIPIAEIGRSAAVATAQAKVMDLRQQSDGMLVDYRRESLHWLALGAGLSLAVLAIGLRDVRLVLRVFVPVALAVAATAAIILMAGISLSLFHLMALSVVAGLGYDYTLFLDKLRAEPVLDGATIHAVALCVLSTVSSYALLCLSQLPILNGIGLTVTIGSIAVFVIAGLFAIGARREARR